MSNPNTKQTRCCIVGGGPAGIMLGYLLSRAGVPVIVLEKHADFFRDFRGDTIHPSTLELLHELGLLERFLKLPHQQYPYLCLELDGKVIKGPDFSHLPTACKFIAIAPQWDFLNFLADDAKQSEQFELLMNTEAKEFVQTDGRVTGVIAQTSDGELQINADLVVAADGRRSTLRDQSQLQLDEHGVPIDVLWYHLPRIEDKKEGHVLGRIRDGKMMITLDRGDYFQCATIIPKGQFEEIQAAGLPAFRKNIVELAPFLKPSVDQLQDWNQVKLLTVQMNRLEKWFLPGLLCIGDAAHAMSPVGGVGVNIAIQDAVATANILAEKLDKRNVTLADLEQVQKRREWPAKMTQKMQAFAHQQLFDPQRGFGKTFLFSFPARMILKLFAPIVRRRLARTIGLGVRPEQVQTPDRRSSPSLKKS